MLFDEPGGGVRTTGRGTSSARSRWRPAMTAVAAFVLLVVVWELVKLVVPDDGVSIAGTRVLPRTSDAAMPHVWTVLGRLFDPEVAGAAQQRSIGAAVLSGAFFTLRLSLGGLLLGGVLGVLLAVVMQRSGLLERALLPYVVASQTVPILAISPLIVVATKAGWVSVAIVSAYLTFFPVTIAALRGLRAADARAFELMRSYGASAWAVLWKVRLPSSVPYLFASLRVAAAAAVIGAIIGELPSGIPDGLGASLLNYNQYYTSGPERLWATIVMCSLVGLAFVGLVRLSEWLLTRNRYRPVEALAA
jgi:NitT/TauT family transport system permease protein